MRVRARGRSICGSVVCCLASVLISSIAGQRGLDGYATGAWQLKVPLLGEVDNNMADSVRTALGNETYLA